VRTTKFPKIKIMFRCKCSPSPSNLNCDKKCKIFIGGLGGTVPEKNLHKAIWDGTISKLKKNISNVDSTGSICHMSLLASFSLTNQNDPFNQKRENAQCQVTKDIKLIFKFNA
jgi:hypothetical protein